MPRHLPTVRRAVWVSTFVLVAALALPAERAVGGHTIASGDCWQTSTPIICRNTWSDNQYLWVRLIDQLSNSQLHSKADSAGANWTTANGPQIVQFIAHSNDTWIYLKRSEFCTAPCGVTYNCNQGMSPVCSYLPRAMMIVWSEIYVPLGNKDQAKGTTVFAHEYGHALGLAHHGSACTPLMSSGLAASGCGRIESPTSTDIGYLPPCQGTQHGILCIYRWD
jgi:hypothetical protein